MDPGIRRWMASFPSEEESVHRAVEPYRRASPEELAWAIDQACALAEELARAQPDTAELLARRDRRSPRSEQLWIRLVQEARHERRGL